MTQNERLTYLVEEFKADSGEYRDLQTPPDVEGQREVLRSLMMDTDELANDVGSIVDGKRAVEIGLIDRLGGLGEAVSELKRMIKEKK